MEHMQIITMYIIHNCFICHIPMQYIIFSLKLSYYNEYKSYLSREVQ